MADNCPECSAVWDGGTCRKCGWQPHAQEKTPPPAYREFEGRVYRREAPAPETVEAINALYARLGVGRKFGDPFREQAPPRAEMSEAEIQRRKTEMLAGFSRALRGHR